MNRGFGRTTEDNTGLEIDAEQQENYSLVLDPCRAARSARVSFESYSPRHMLVLVPKSVGATALSRKSPKVQGPL